MQSLHQPISLWVVGHGLQLLHAEDLAHFIDYTTHEVSTSCHSGAWLGLQILKCNPETGTLVMVLAV